MSTTSTIRRPINILHVEDEKNWQESVAERMKRIVPKVAGSEVNITATADFVYHYQRIEAGEFDLLILDLRDAKVAREGQNAGKDLWDKLLSTQFMPVIFLTGNETVLNGEIKPPGFVEVVSKSSEEWWTNLESAFARIWEQRIIQIKLAVQACLTTRPPEIIRTFYKEFVERYSQGGHSVTEDTSTVAKLMARHIVGSLEKELVQRVRTAVSATLAAPTDDSTEKVDAAEFYHVPPALPYLCTGMMVRHSETQQLWIVATPTCDLVESDGRQAKCSHLLMLPVKAITDWPTFTEWKEQWSRVDALVRRKIEKEQREGNAGEPNSELRQAKDRLKELEKTIWEFVELRSSNLRFYYLPALLKLIPQAHLDFQDITVIEYAAVQTWERIANLSSPFAEHLQSKYAQYVGRIGVPEPRRDGMSGVMEQTIAALNN